LLAVEETHSFTQTFVNAVRFGYNHERVDNDASVKAINPVAADNVSGSFRGPERGRSKRHGASSLPGGVGGLPTYLYDGTPSRAMTTLSSTTAGHTIKFGFAFERMFMQATALTDGQWNLVLW